MINSDKSIKKSSSLAFSLNVEDGWPPVAIENIPCTKMDSGFKIDIPPLFVNGLSVGDIISVELDSLNNVTSWEHIFQSKRTTIWILGLNINKQKSIFNVLIELNKLNCHTVSLKEYNYFSVDVPNDCSIDLIDTCLSELNQDFFSIVYPSFRHDE
ncbi:MAG: hypothetical protein RL344_1487 [Pseudomonadota bacterium]